MGERATVERNFVTAGGSKDPAVEGTLEGLTAMHLTVNKWTVDVPDSFPYYMGHGTVPQSFGGGIRSEPGGQVHGAA